MNQIFSGKNFCKKTNLSIEFHFFISSNSKTHLLINHTSSLLISSSKP